MVAETSDLPVTVIVELDTFVNRHSWDSGGIDAMLVFFKELVWKGDRGVVSTEYLRTQVIHHAFKVVIQTTSVDFVKEQIVRLFALRKFHKVLVNVL